MKQPSALLFLALCTALAPESQAQTPKPTPPPPAPPLVTEPPPGSTFTIIIEYGDSAQPKTDADSPAPPHPASKDDRPVAVQVWRDAKSRRIVVKHANGTQSEGYLFESGFVVRSTANSDKTFVSGSLRGRDASFDLFTKDFQATQWIDMMYYSGVQEEKEGQFYVFRQAPGEPPPPDPGADGPPSGYRPLDYMELTALLRIADKTPAVVKLGPATYIFSPITPWSGTIEMPGNFKSSAESFAKEVSVLEALRSKKTKSR